jgi:hypothetical protein
LTQNKISRLGVGASNNLSNLLGDGCLPLAVKLHQTQNNASSASTRGVVVAVVPLYKKNVLQCTG